MIFFPLLCAFCCLPVIKVLLKLVCCALLTMQFLTLCMHRMPFPRTPLSEHLTPQPTPDILHESSRLIGQAASFSSCTQRGPPWRTSDLSKKPNSNLMRSTTRRSRTSRMPMHDTCRETRRPEDSCSPYSRHMMGKRSKTF